MNDLLVMDAIKVDRRSMRLPISQELEDVNGFAYEALLPDVEIRNYMPHPLNVQITEIQDGSERQSLQSVRIRV